MKIRGTAAHIAEKYLALARDAMSAGDVIIGESYLQHAEHYNRLIMAAQAQSAQPSQNQPERGNGGQRPNGPNHDLRPAAASEEAEPTVAEDWSEQEAQQDAAESSPRVAENAGKRRRKSANGSAEQRGKARREEADKKGNGGAAAKTGEDAPPDEALT